MTRHLRPVVAGESGPQDMSMADAIDDLATKAKAAEPVSVMMVWETADGEEHRIFWGSAPNSWPLQKGLSAELYDKLHPPAENVE